MTVGRSGRRPVHIAHARWPRRLSLHYRPEEGTQRGYRGLMDLNSGGRGTRRVGTANREPGTMPEERDQQEQQLRNRYKIRQVTNIQASWVEEERGEEGKFTLQLILDNGVDEYVLDVDSDDLEVMLRLFKISEHTTFDLERKVLMFGTLSVK
jgi:hypothetical protein